MLIEDLLCKLRPISFAYEQITYQLQNNISEIWGVLRKNGHEEEYNAIEGFLMANIALNKSLKDLVNEYQNNVDKNFSQLFKNEI